MALRAAGLLVSVKCDPSKSWEHTAASSHRIDTPQYERTLKDEDMTVAT